MTDVSCSFDGILDYRPAQLVLVPEHLRGGLQRYIEFGVLPGSALRSILRNAPVAEVIGRLDEDALAGLQDTIIFLNNYAPGLCWGSSEFVDAWAAKGGLSRLSAR